MSGLPTPPRTLTIDSGSCLCGYNLSGLSYHDRCPECGRAIASMEYFRRMRKERNLRVGWVVVVLVLTAAVLLFVGRKLVEESLGPRVHRPEELITYPR
jgi:hypothetical protein